MHSVIYVKSYHVNHLYPDVPRCRFSHCSLVSLSRVMLLKIYSSSHCSNQLTIVPRLRLGADAQFYAGFLSDCIIMGLVHVDNIVASSYEQVPSGLKDSVHVGSCTNPGICNLSSPSSTIVLDLWVGEVWNRNLIQGHPLCSILFSTLLGHLWPSVYITLYCMRKLQW